MAKLIVLRGNSGSGKSSVAKAIQTKVIPHPILIEHDHIRRNMLKEREGPNVKNPELIYAIAQYAVENNSDLILEGIMRMDIYHDLFERLMVLFPDSHYFYYFDIPFEETVRRHQTKNGVDFGIEEMQEWFKENDTTGFAGEKIISSSNSLEATTEQIINEVGLRQ